MNVEKVAMTPKEHVEQLQRIYEEGGEEALLKFATTNPIEYLKAIEAFYIVEGDDEGLEEFQAQISEECRSAVDDLLTQDGFARFNEMIRFARENDMDDTADRLESYLKLLLH